MSPRHPVRDISDLIRVLWHCRYPILAATAVAAVVTAIVATVLPTTYRAEATLQISESKFGATGGGSVFFNPRLFHTYTAIITRREALGEVLTEFPGLREREISVDDLAHAVKVELVSNSRLMNISLVLDDARLAADVVNSLARRAEEYTQSDLYLGEAEASRRRLEPELLAAHENLLAAQRRLDEATALGTDTALEQVVRTLSDARQALIVERAPLAAGLAAQTRERAEGVSFDDRLSDIQETRTAFRREHRPESLEHLRDTLFLSRRSLIHRIASAEVDRGAAAGELRALQQSGRESPETGATWGGLVRELYTAGMGAYLEQRVSGIDSEIEQARATLRAIESSAEAVQSECIWASLQDDLLEDEYDLIRLQQEAFFEFPHLQFPYETLVGIVADYDAQIAQLDEQIEETLAAGGRALTRQTTAISEVTVAEAALTGLQTNYSEAVMRLEERQVGLDLMDAATPPTQPHFPNRRMLTTIGALLTLVLASLIAVLRENLMATAEESERA